MSERYDVLLQGVYCCDLVFTGLPGLPTLGTEIFGTGFDMLPGGTFNTVLALHRLGVQVGWRADFGNDLFSQYVLASARREGIDDHLFCLHDAPFRSLSVSLSFPQDRAFVSYIDPVPAQSFTSLVTRYQPRLVLCPSLGIGPDHLDLCRTAHDIGAIVYMDSQYNDISLSNPEVEAALRAVDVFSPNESEALRLTGTATVEQALARLAELVSLVVIKRGAQGATAQTGNRVIHSPGLQVEVIETTGAGDCFNAGFIYGYLRGDPLDLSLRYGNICGALSTTTRGVLATPHADQVQTMLDQLQDV
jgi:sugar/nucleoside kinase (ribokinase family)